VYPPIRRGGSPSRFVLLLLMVGKDEHRSAASQEDLMDQKDKVNLIGYGISLAVCCNPCWRFWPDVRKSNLSRKRSPPLLSLAPLAAPASLLIIPKANKNPHKILRPLSWFQVLWSRDSLASYVDSETPAIANSGSDSLAGMNSKNRRKRELFFELELVRWHEEGELEGT